MKTFEYKVTDELGLHARPAGLLVRLVKQYQSAVTVSADGKECDAARLMALMAMCIKRGTTVKVTVDGTDEDEAFDAVKRFFSENL